MNKIEKTLMDHYKTSVLASTAIQVLWVAEYVARTAGVQAAKSELKMINMRRSANNVELAKPEPGSVLY